MLSRIKKHQKIIAIGITVSLLYVIFSKINFAEFAQYFQQINLLWVGVAMSLLLPQIIISAARLRLLASNECKLSMRMAIKLGMAGGAFNLLLPSKAGDFVKAVFLKKLRLMKMTEAAGLVIFEKTLDVATISAMSLLGLLFVGITSQFSWLIAAFAAAIILTCAFAFFVDITPFLEGRSKIKRLFYNMYRFFWKLKNNRPLMSAIVLLSVASWFVQLSQFFFLFLAFGEFLSPFVIFALVPAALLFSMLPVTISGWGLREGAMVVLFLPFAPAAMVLGVSVLSSYRYYLPGIVSLPFVYSLSK